MAENHPVDEKRCYPSRTKKGTFDDGSWETYSSKKKKSKVLDKNPVTAAPPNCKKCFLVFKNNNELSKHEKSCLIPKKLGSFLENFPRKADDPRVILEKVVIPSSQDSKDTCTQEIEPGKPVEAPKSEKSNNCSGNILANVSYAEAATSGLAKTAEGSEIPRLNNGHNEGETETNFGLSRTKIQQSKSKKVDKTVKKTVDEIPRINTHQNLTEIENNNLADEVQITIETCPEPVTLPEENMISDAYEEIVKWRRNTFDPPNGNLGKQFVNEMTKQLKNWISTRENKYLQLAMMMPSILLQRTAKSCKGRINKENLRRRFELWEAGRYSELVEEGKCIQNRLPSFSGNINDDDTVVKKFRNHMLRGNVNAALRLLSRTGKSGVLEMNDETMEQLYEKHPAGEPLNDEMLLQGPIRYVHPVIFDEMNEDMVQKVALKIRGAAGPSNFDAKDWRSILVSRVYGTSSTELCGAIVEVAKVLCTEDVSPNVEALMAGRLIPLDKNPGLRPIGIGEVLRRIIGKMVVSVLRNDLQADAGDLQLCAGQKSGCEAGIHAMREIYDDDDTHGIIQVDANNAFNTINRNMFLHNIKIICAEISTFVSNCYLQPARLFVVGGKEILSQEGTTQGAPSSMYVYGLGILPLIAALSLLVEQVRQSAFADDLAGGGTIEQLRKWWDGIIYLGKFIGYTAKPAKSWLIVKPAYHQCAVENFEGTGIKITTEGNRHLGAAVGSQAFKIEYVGELIDEWIYELKNLNKIARVEPHLAYSAYIFGFQHKYTYFLRTIPDISAELKRLDKAIDEQLLKPILDNHNFNYSERQWYSLPPRKGGLGIIIPSEVSDYFYRNSRYMTTDLVTKIVNQHRPAENENEPQPPQIQLLQAEKQQREDDKVMYVKSTLNPVKMKIFEAITEKGASNWLTAMPIKEHGFYLNKQEFWDSIRTRYGISLTRLPSKCVACGVPFNVEHAFSCKNGGFVTIRHNEIRDFTAEVLREVCHNVEIEPLLTPLTGERFQYRTANTDDQARLDVSARGVWTRGSKAFFDVRVFNPLAPSYRNQTLVAAHRSNENEKKRKYRERIQNVEHGSFTPLVFTSFGGMSIECLKFFNHISDRICEKRNITGSLARSWIRTKLCFSLLRTANLCIRGSKSQRSQPNIELSSTSFTAAVAETRMDTY